MTKSEERLDQLQHLTWMLDEMREGRNKKHYYCNYIHAHRNNPLLTEEETQYFDSAFEGAAK
jgi:hypothetical protein